MQPICSIAPHPWGWRTLRDRTTGAVGHPEWNSGNIQHPHPMAKFPPAHIIRSVLVPQGPCSRTSSPRAWGALAPSITLPALQTWKLKLWLDPGLLGIPHYRAGSLEVLGWVPRACMAQQPQGTDPQSPASTQGNSYLGRNRETETHQKTNFTEHLGYAESAHLEALHFISWVWGIGMVLLLVWVLFNPSFKETEASKML